MDNTVFEDKKALRQHVKKLKANLTTEEKLNHSNLIWQSVEALDVFTEAERVLLYWSLDDEVQTHDFVNKWSKNKSIYLPVINGETLDIVRFEDECSLIMECKFGVAEPCGERLSDITTLDLMIVPGVAFDVENNRMGRGKAFYDKLLCNTDIFKLGVCFPCQLFPQVPHDENDVKMDLVIIG